MTIPFSLRQSGPYIATAGQTVFNYNFKLLAAIDLQVWRQRAGVEELLELDVHYVVTGVGDEGGGTVVLKTGYEAEAGDIYLNSGEREVSRASQFVAWRSAEPAAIDREFDRFYVTLLELNRRALRSVQSPRFSTVQPVLPSPVAGRVIGWNEAADGLENISTPRLAPRGAWAALAIYAEGDIVERNGAGYMCHEGHTATFDTEPGAGVDWETAWMLLASRGADGDPGPAGPGSGNMLAANNLSDLTNIGVARSNLGLGPLATQTVIGTPDIQADAVTYDKIQNVSATDRLLGRATPGAGNIEEITCTGYGRSLIAAASMAAAQIVLGLVIGTNVQAHSAALDVWAGWSPPSSAIVGITDTQALTNKTIDASSNAITNLTLAMFAANVIDNDATLAANSSARVATQAAIKSYVDNAVTGLKWKDSVAVATTANITLSGEQTIDGVTTSASRVLVKNQTNATENGIYVSAAGAWSRATDSDAGAELAGAAVLVTQGTSQNTTQWTCSNSSITLGSTSITFVQMGGAGTYSAAGGLQLAGNQFSIANDGVTFAKLQNIATASLIGRATAGTGDPESITLNATLEFAGTALQRAALTGDVTAGAGSNATTIAANAVTFAKFQQIATASLVGRASAGAGNAENITLNATLEMAGAALQRAALTGDVTASAGSNATTITANAVTFAKFQQIATAKLIGRQTASTGNVEAIGVAGGIEFDGSGNIQVASFSGDVTKTGGGTTLTIAANAVTDAKLRDSAALSVIGRAGNTVGDPGDIAAANDGEVLRRSGAALGFGTIATDGIATNAVTYAKIQQVSATDKLLGRAMAGAGVIEEIACTAFGRSLIDDADASAARTTLGLVIGTNVLAYSAKIQSIAGGSYADGQVPVFNQTTGLFEPGAGSGGGGGAPTDADYLVKTSNASLSAERVVTDTASVVADWSSGGQVRFNVPGYSQLLNSVAYHSMMLADVLNFAQFPSADRISDSFDDLTYVDTAGATNLSTATAGVLKGTDGTAQASTSTPAGAMANATYTIVNRDLTLTNNATVTQVGVYSTSAVTIDVKIVKRNSAGNYDVVVSQSFSHPGTGWADLTLSSPYVVPASGTYHLGAYSASNFTTLSAARAYKAGNTGVSSSNTFTEDTNDAPGMRYTYVSGVSNVTVASAALPLTVQPDVMFGQLLVKEVDAAVANTDFFMDFSRDNGATWVTAVLTLLRSIPLAGGVTLKHYGSDNADVTGHAFSTACKYRLRTANAKRVEFHAVYVYGT